MGVTTVKIDGFRCLVDVELSPSEHVNLIVGDNGEGKTSVLEALYFLGRGRSFRPGQTAALIRHGQESFTLFARVAAGRREHRLGVRGKKGGLEINIDGRAGCAVSDLAAGLPVQVIDPQVHELIQGGPEYRRRFIDWGVFHVKHRFLGSWQRYRRALQQRNAAIRAGESRDSVTMWNSALLESGNSVDSSRRDYLGEFQPALARLTDRLLGQPACCRYLPGWRDDQDFAAALAASWDRDRAIGATQVGPHRAELAIELEGRAARHRLSRGQQKLLASAMVLAQSEFVAAAADRDVALLVDEPAAELDRHHLARLLDALPAPGIQLFVTALTPEALPVSWDARKFHVKHGAVTSLV